MLETTITTTYHAKSLDDIAEYFDDLADGVSQGRSKLQQAVNEAERQCWTNAAQIIRNIELEIEPSHELIELLISARTMLAMLLATLGDTSDTEDEQVKACTALIERIDTTFGDKE